MSCLAAAAAAAFSPVLPWQMSSFFLTFLLGSIRCARTKTHALSLWIDEDQVKSFIGVRMEIFIIKNGVVTHYLRSPEIEKIIPALVPTVETVNLTWESGDRRYSYWFNQLTSLDPSLLHDPLLSIPASGEVPMRPTVFQVAIPCTGIKDGIASMSLGLEIFDQNGRPVDGSPIKLRLRKQCRALALSPYCQVDCKNDGKCNKRGLCDCPQGFFGDYCEIAVCYPRCQNNGTCIPPKICKCPEGFSGTRCEIALCQNPCQNGGRCLKRDHCWCSPGYYGEACQYRDEDRIRRSNKLKRERKRKRKKRKRKRRKRRKRKNRPKNKKRRKRKREKKRKKNKRNKRKRSKRRKKPKRKPV